MRRFIPGLPALAVLIPLLACSSLEAKEKVTWVPDTKAALEKGKSEGKNVILVFYTDW